MAMANYSEEELSREPESIQPHAAAIVIKEPELTILQVSANTWPHFGFAPEELLDQPLAMLLGDTEVERLRDQYLSKDLDASPHYLPATQIGKGGRLFELALHRYGGKALLECELKPDDANTRPVFPASLTDAIARIRRAESVGRACQAVVDESRGFTSFDRVMVFKFKEDGSGTVIAESLGGNFKPCMGMHYPRSNITRQAQAIYRSGRLMMKVDIHGQAVPMVPPATPGARAPLDMSYALTRDLAPDYGARLRKTGVTALMFIPIAKNDGLWGLIMFYNHTGPKYVSHDARMACDLLAHCLSMRIVAEVEAKSHKYMARIVELNAELERSNVELDSFAWEASHDLKEPLRGIHRYSTFLMEDYADKLDKAGIEKLQTIIMLSRRMETLIDSLLHFSRIGRAEMTMREVDLEEVVTRTLEIIAPRVQECDAEIRRPRRLPVVRANHARVGEIFHNLIVNALKYNDKPVKWVEIGWEDGAENGRMEAWDERETEKQGDNESHKSLRPSVPPSPVFYVRDNGIGIPERHYETVFGIFRRLHERNEFGGGAGAGLTIVKKIVERHNGRIWIESRMGAGTTVYFTLG